MEPVVAQELPQKQKTNKTRPVSEARKIRKPLMERKRRERINTSLNELARLLTEAKKVDSEGNKATKLEKADILELTVTHLQSIHSSETNKPEGVPSSPDAEEKYSQGFSECIKVVEKILKRSTTEVLRERLLSHLNSKLKILKSSKIKKESRPSLEGRNIVIEGKKTTSLEETLKCQDEISMKNLTLVPTELPGGRVAFIIKGDTKNLLKEWGHIKNEKNVFLSSEKENNNCPMPTISTKNNRVLWQQDLNTQYNNNSSFQANNACVSQLSNNMETSSFNPVSESTNILDISTNTPPPSSKTPTIITTQTYLPPALPSSTMHSDPTTDYCYPCPTVSRVPTGDLNAFSPGAQTLCLSDAYYPGSLVSPAYSTPTNHAQGIPLSLIPSVSHASINLSDADQNSLRNRVSNSVPSRSFCHSSSPNSQGRIPHKAHCPPTPPPSPPSGAEHRKASIDNLNEPENRLVHEAEIDIDQPFDLSMNKMWRPW